MINKLYLDADGVLIDFDRHYADVVGPLPDRNDPARDVDWKKISDIDFFLTAPPMPDAFELLDFVGHLNPTVLTGAPSTGYERAAKNKKESIKRLFGPNLPVIVTASKLKFHLAEPGALLVDDWEKYKSLWVAKGGLWVTHTTASNTIEELKKLGVSPFKD